MYVYEDGTVTGSVNQAELDAIHAAMKKRGVKFPASGYVETADQLLHPEAYATDDSEAGTVTVAETAKADVKASDAKKGGK